MIIENGLTDFLVGHRISDFVLAVKGLIWNLAVAHIATLKLESHFVPENQNYEWHPDDAPLT